MNIYVIIVNGEILEAFDDERTAQIYAEAYERGCGDPCYVEKIPELYNNH